MPPFSCRPALSRAVAVSTLLSVFLPLVALAPLPAWAEDEKEVEDMNRRVTVVGRHERVALIDGGLTLDAKVDTGADSSSIDANNIEEFDRDDEKWVRFEVSTNDGKVVTIERPVVDRVTIVQSSGRTERLVVELDLCIGTVQSKTEVNLADREGLDFRMLVGKGLLARERLLVNVAEEYNHEPACDGMIER
ncbi:MAG: ATP-dependent zinc protease [Paracoccaceae bacterium]